MKATVRFGVITLAALVGVGVTFSLGRWQLSRAATKERLHAEVVAQGRLSALSTAEVLAQADPLLAVHRSVQVRGTWLADKTVFLDNRQMQGKPGLYVVTPLQLEGGAAVVLVQRGWVQRNFVDRTRLPEVATSGGLVTVRGSMAPPPAKLYDLGGSDTGLIRQNLDLAQFRAETGLPLMAVSIQQSGAPSEGLQRDWPIASSGVEKNQGYAVQWFGLSALITVLYVWFQIVRKIFPRR